MLKSSLRRVLATLWKDFSKSSFLKEKSKDHNKGSATEQAWPEKPSLKDPESIQLSYLRHDENRWKEIKTRTSTQLQPSSGGMAANLVVLLFANGNLSFVLFERPG